MASTTLSPPSLLTNLGNKTYQKIVDDAITQVDNITFTFTTATPPVKNKNLYVHVILTDALTGKTAFDTDTVTGKIGILLNRETTARTELNADTNTYEYSFKIPTNMLDGKLDTVTNTKQRSWKNGRTYKLQIRITYEELHAENLNELNDLLIEKANLFSEWSNVGIFRTITLPTISINMLDNSGNRILGQKTEWTNITNSSFDILGKYIQPSAAKDGLKQYNMTVYRVDTSETQIYKSKTFDSEDNSFEIDFPFNFQNNTDYKIVIKFLSFGGFGSSVTLKVHCSYDTSFVNDVILTVKTVEEYQPNPAKSSLGMENDEGFINLRVYAKANKFANLQKLDKKIIVLKRASEETSFRKWESIKTFDALDILEYSSSSSGEYLLHSFKDFTAKSNVNYKYGVQVRTITVTTVGETERKDIKETQILTNNIQVNRDFNYSYLLGDEKKQLKLAFNDKVNSFSRSIKDNIFESIGGSYPLFSRIGKSKSRTFTISGLISAESDENKRFTHEEDLYGSMDKNRQDYYTERIFREEVMDFLYDGKPKLYKSATEGNIIVKLTNISLTPDNSLNRLIYSFSCTATECMELTEDNCKEYVFPNEEETEVENVSTHYGKLFDIYGNVLAKFTKEELEVDRVGYQSLPFALLGTESEMKKVTTISFPSDATFIGNGAFASCIGLKELKISNPITKIGNKAFYDCHNVESVIFNKGYLTTIGTEAFAKCSYKITDSDSNAVDGLKITLPSKVATVGNKAFDNVYYVYYDKSNNYSNVNDWGALNTKGR